MKKSTLFLTLLLALAGCSSQKYFSLTGTTTTFAEYAQNGFTVSTTVINQEFEPVGMVEAVCLEGTDRNQPRPPADLSDPLYNQPAAAASSYRTCTTSELIEVLYQEAVNVGANGIIQMEFVPVEGGVVARALAVNIKK